MAIVTVQSKDGSTELVTSDTFRAWKQANGARAAFAITAQDDGVTIVDSLLAMRSLPDGDFTGERLQREQYQIEDSKLKRKLRGFEMWRSV